MSIVNYRLGLGKRLGFMSGLTSPAAVARGATPEHDSEYSEWEFMTSCARGDTIRLRPCKLTMSSHLFARWHLFRQAGYLRHQQVDLWPVSEMTYTVSSGTLIPYYTIDLLTLKVVSESRVTWATCVPIFVFIGLSVLELGLMYATDRQTSDKSIA